MTSRGELYIQEDCRDYFEESLNDWFGDEWDLDGSEFSDFWDMDNFPEKCEVRVITGNDRDVIGKVEITSKVVICDEGHGRYIDVVPKSIKKLTEG